MLRVLLTAALLVAVVRAVVVIVAPPEAGDAPPVVTPELARLTLGLLMPWVWEENCIRQQISTETHCIVHSNYFHQSVQ